MIALLFAGCTKNLVSYSTSTRQDEETEKTIQFTLSSKMDIVLERAMSESETKVDKGVLVIKNGKKINQVIIPGGTKGAIINRLGDIVWVSFEKDDNLWLPFQESANKKNDYVLISPDSLKYGDETYGITSGRFSQILFDLQKINKKNKQKHFAKGRKV